MIFLLDRKGKYLKGININYLTFYKTDQLLQERNKWTTVPTLRLSRKLRWYELYDDAIRTYKKGNVKQIRKIAYKYHGEDVN